MTREKILNTPEIVDFMIDKSVMAESKMKLHERLDELCKLAIKALDKEPCEMTAEEYRQRMIQAFHNADCDELIAICVLPIEKEFEHLEWLLKSNYKKEPCDDCISRQAVLDKAVYTETEEGWSGMTVDVKDIEALPPVKPQEPQESEVDTKQLIYCKDCKYFEYDSVAKVDGIPLIVAHEICNRWGDGCKTNENGYCFLAESEG